MGINFRGDAIVLSGVTGTKLKCDILGGYYPTWWGITSGGDGMGHALPTSIVELNSGTGLDFIEDTGDVVLGSSGHALQLKAENPNAHTLKVFLVEDDRTCFEHLRNVIRTKWPQIDLAKAEVLGPENTSGVYLINKALAPAMDEIRGIQLGNSLFFFDPLLFTPWSEIERAASMRIRSYYENRTEFIVFLFTTDWFRGRATIPLVPLPRTTNESMWSAEELNSILKMDRLFGGTEWRGKILTDASQDLRVERLVAEYRKRLHKWFRYVRPMPFRPKEGQMYHLFMCTNYERGIGITTSFYNKFTGHPSVRRELSPVYANFRKCHPEAMLDVDGRHKPVPWRFIVEITRDHDEGICDDQCLDLGQIEPDPLGRKDSLEWLEREGYLVEIPSMTSVWKTRPTLYQLNWPIVTKRLGMKPPSPLLPLEPKAIESQSTR